MTQELGRATTRFGGTVWGYRRMAAPIPNHRATAVERLDGLENYVSFFSL
jgi:hypothetical protein